jgi:hypothetical protein
VPTIPGYATQGETFEELLGNLYEAVEECLSVDIELRDVQLATAIERKGWTLARVKGNRTSTRNLERLIAYRCRSTATLRS